VIADHYATLGVSASASRAAIRAAYLDLIRRYHPDVNPSAEAEARVRAITAAYAVLGSPQKRARYDAGRFQQRAARTTAPAYQRPHRRRLTPWIVLAASVAAILLIVPRLVAPPVYPAERIVRTAALAPPREPLLRKRMSQQSRQTRGVFARRRPCPIWSSGPCSGGLHGLAERTRSLSTGSPPIRRSGSICPSRSLGILQRQGSRAAPPSPSICRRRCSWATVGRALPTRSSTLSKRPGAVLEA
jgi:hypothetical protein